MEIKAELLPITEIDSFMLITPVPKIAEDISFVKMLGNSSSSEFLDEGRNEFKIALNEQLANVKL